MSASQELRELPVGLIEPNLSQVRRYFDERALQALAGSLRERGVLQPVLVRSGLDGKYELVVGERRWRAAKIAGLQTIPGLVCPYDDALALEAALIENMAREDLNPVEKARACVMLVKELGLTLEQVGQRVGLSRVAVSNLVRLLGLSQEILELLERGKLREGHGRALLMAKDLKVRRQLADGAIEEGWSVRTLEARARASNNDGSAPNGSGSVPDNAVPAQRLGPRQEGQDLDVTVMNVARVWGDALGAEVFVRSLHGRKLRVEFVFDSPEGALALGGKIAEAVTLMRSAARRNNRNRRT
jgi:ParB family chromosome partitioning protein